MIYSGLKLLLGVSSSIAAYRALDIASTVVKGGGQVRVVMTENAAKLVSPKAFDAITTQRTIVSLWDSDRTGEMDHLAATKWANVFAVAPASAGTIARLALGLADDALSTFSVAWPYPLVVAPAMNPTMYQHATVHEHLQTLRGRGNVIVPPAFGPTACGDQGQGRLAEVADILITIVDCFRHRLQSPDLSGQHILITSGPTREFADPVRCITNPATGRMGVALARQALRCGAKVTLVTGPCDIPMPPNLTKLLRIVTAEEMRDAVIENLPDATMAIFAAAVSDWRPVEKQTDKAKKEDGPTEASLQLVRTPDVAASANEHRREGQVFVGFAAESQDLVQNARDKMRRKGFDLVVANSIVDPGSGFGTDTNAAVLLSADGQREIPQMTKDLLAIEILTEASRIAHGEGPKEQPNYPLGLSDA